MRAFPFAHAGVDPAGPVTHWTGWQSLAEHCVTMLPSDARGVGLLYVTDPLGGDIDTIVEFLRARTGIADWSGAVAPAICAPGVEYFDVPAMAVMLLDLPALDVLKEDVGELLARDLRRLAGYIHAALPVAGSDQADYVVRNLAGMDTAHGLIAVAEALDVGDRLMFVRRDAASAVEDMQRMLGDLKRRAGDRVRGAVYHSCVARGPHLFGPGARELTMIAETFGDIPVVGFFGNGEISNNRLYTYTGILSLFIDDADGG